MDTNPASGEICRGSKECIAAEIRAVTTRETQIVVRGKPRTITIPLCAGCAKAWDDRHEGDIYWG